MCGIAGAFSLDHAPIPQLERRLEVMNQLIRHRGAPMGKEPGSIRARRLALLTGGWRSSI